MINIGTLSAFVLVSIGVVVLRHKRPDLRRGYRVPFAPVLPIVSALLCFYLMLNLPTLTWVRFVVWLAAGVAIYLAYGRRHAPVGLEADRTVTPHDRRVVIRTPFGELRKKRQANT